MVSVPKIYRQKNSAKNTVIPHRNHYRNQLLTDHTPSNCNMNRRSRAKVTHLAAPIKVVNFSQDALAND